MEGLYAIPGAFSSLSFWAALHWLSFAYIYERSFRLTVSWSLADGRYEQSRKLGVDETRREWRREWHESNMLMPVFWLSKKQLPVFHIEFFENYISPRLVCRKITSWNSRCMQQEKRRLKWIGVSTTVERSIVVENECPLKLWNRRP